MAPHLNPKDPTPGTRRGFLKLAAVAAAGACTSSCAPKPSGAGRGTGSAGVVRVRIDLGNADDASRLLRILRERIQERCPQQVVAARSGAGIILSIDDRLPADGFRIASDAGDRGAVRVAGGSTRGLLYGVGKLLRTSGYDEGVFRVSGWRGSSVPQGSLRGVYFASHFHNWYHQASEPEIVRYLEDLALWGVNAIMVIFPMINLQGWEDPQAEPAMAMVRQYARAAHALGLEFATGLNNTMFIGAPKSIRATPLPDPTGRRGNSGHPICPSIPEGRAYLVENSRRLFAKLSDAGLDILCHWPYDEGGCACERCRPWGSNAYLALSRDLTRVGREYFPRLKSVLSTWMFDTPEEGEWQGLARALAQGNDAIDYILADSHEDFPRYPLDVGVPGGLPLVNFPEISMWGNWPWGGFGANPLPARLQRLWDQVRRKVAGGFPYSEGIYEDMNKAVVAQFYWDRDRSARSTLEEYIGYEFGAGVTPEVVAVVEALEAAASDAFRRRPVDRVAVLRAAELAERVEGRLPDWGRRNWRWEIVRLRTILDRERFGGGGLETPAAEAAMVRLIEIYHCQMETDDPYHHRVRPPLKRAVSRRGKA